MSFLRTNWRRISTMLMVATVISVCGYKAYAAATEDCCAPGAPCCHPGSPCCNHGKTAAK